MTTVLLRALAIVWTPVACAFAEPAPVPELTDRVADREDMTFADLVRLVVPGIAANGETAPGGGIIDVRHIGGEAWSSPGPEVVKLLHFEAVPAHSGGRNLMLLLLDFGDAKYNASGFVVLALFDVAGQPRLLDAADVAFDRWTSLAEPVRSVGAGGTLLVIRSTHFNSNQSYATTALILLRNTRFDLIDSISTFDDRACAFDRTQRLDIQPGTGAPFADIEASVTERTTATKGRCGDAIVPEPATRTITATYHWNAAKQRYIPDSNAFDMLARENAARF